MPPLATPAAIAIATPAPAKPGSGGQDIAWGRPIFRPPALPSPRLALAPLALRSPFGAAPRPAAVR
jgi:hypothetical protein